MLTIESETVLNSLDFSTPETFITSILPWLEKETGLKANLEKLPLPFPVEVYDHPLDVGYSVACGIYDHNRNTLAIVQTNSMDYTASIAVHEMVHWLQNANGWLNSENPEKGKPREVVEKLAYETQYKFLSEVLHRIPEEFGMTKEAIAKALAKERLQGLAINQGNVLNTNVEKKEERL